MYSPRDLVIYIYVYQPFWVEDQGTPPKQNEGNLEIRWVLRDNLLKTKYCIFFSGERNGTCTISRTEDNQKIERLTVELLFTWSPKSVL